MRTLKQEFEFAEAKKQMLTIQATKRITKMYKQLAKDMAKELEQLPKDSPFISNSIKQMYLENYIAAIDSEIDKLTQEIGISTKDDMEKISEIVVKANKDWMNQFGMNTTKAFSTVPTDVVNYIVGMVVAGVVGYLCIKFMLYTVKKKNFKGFSIYCMIAGIVSVIWYFVA